MHLFATRALSSAPRAEEAGKQQNQPTPGSDASLPSPQAQPVASAQRPDWGSFVLAFSFLSCSWSIGRSVLEEPLRPILILIPTVPIS